MWSKKNGEIVVNVEQRIINGVVEEAVYLINYRDRDGYNWSPMGLYNKGVSKKEVKEFRDKLNKLYLD